MIKRVVLAGLIAAAAVALGYASQSDSKVNVVRNQPAGSGKQMYMSYCASCHGVDGRGSGPLASSLKVPPADLTQLSRNNNGTYPSNYVISVLRFGTTTPAHGTASMPVWGTIFAQMDGGERSLTRSLRISNLSVYLQTIQVK
jgi:mono/diheme cytochrome c family protein